jgi:hypothetical protein
MISTEEGIEIIVRPLEANASLFIRVNFESQSKVIDVSEVH